MTTRTIARKLCLLSAMAIGLSGSLQASDHDVASFYDGKTVILSVGYSAGGGYDLYARTVARHLGKHIPGEPNVAVRNVPGAGSLVLMNQLANSMPADGLNIASVGSGIAFEPLFENEQAAFDVFEVNWLANILETTSTAGMVHKNSGIESWEQLKTETVTFGATSTTSNTGIIPTAIADLMDLNINVITGYPGQSEVFLAMERGEVQGIGSYFLPSMKANNPQFLEPDSDYRIIYQLGLQKDPAIPDVPLVSEMATTDLQRAAADVLATRLTFGRPYAAPPGVPEERVAALRQAMQDLLNDPEFLDDAANQNMQVDYTSPERLQQFYRNAYDSSPEVIQTVIELL